MSEHDIPAFEAPASGAANPVASEAASTEKSTRKAPARRRKKTAVLAEATPLEGAAPESDSDNDAARKRKRRPRSKPAKAAADPRQAELPIDGPTAEPDAASPATEAPPLPAAPAVTIAAHEGTCIEVFGWQAGTPLPGPMAYVLASPAVLEALRAVAPQIVGEALPESLELLEARIAADGGRALTIVVDGDPACDGPGRALLSALGPGRVRLHAAPGAAQRALTRIGLSVQQVEFIALARVGVNGLAARLRRARLYAIDPAELAPQAIGRLLEQQGFHQARTWVVEPGADGAIHALLAFELSDSCTAFPAGSQLIVFSAAADGSSREWPGVPASALRRALPEAARLLALAWLQPGDDEIGWSIEPEEAALALDWARARPAAELYCIGVDAHSFAAACDLHGAGEGARAVDSGAFRSLETLPDPDLVFIRAGEEFTQQVRTAWDRLQAGGRMVVAAEDEHSRLELMQFANREPPLDWQDLSVAQGSREGARAHLAAVASVRLMGWRKPPRG